jgi:gamma-glutamylcyclotransferase (GGCT)/AIG2-like uncharacterized protein YtfP
MVVPTECEPLVRIFFYGTLMDAEIRAAVLGDLDRDRPVEAATLAGYRRVILRGRRYPAIVAERSSSVEGCLSRDLDQRAVDKLDAFETEEYDRLRCTVSLADGKTVEAWTYVAGRLANPTSVSWNLAAWQRNHKRELLRSLRGRRA